MNLGTFGTHHDAGAVEAEAVHVLADRMLLPKRGEQPVAAASSCHALCLETYVEIRDMCGFDHMELALERAS